MSILTSSLFMPSFYMLASLPLLGSITLSLVSAGYDRKLNWAKNLKSTKDSKIIIVLQVHRLNYRKLEPWLKSLLNNDYPNFGIRIVYRQATKSQLRKCRSATKGKNVELTINKNKKIFNAPSNNVIIVEFIKPYVVKRNFISDILQQFTGLKADYCLLGVSNPSLLKYDQIIENTILRSMSSLSLINLKRVKHVVASAKTLKAYQSGKFYAPSMLDISNTLKRAPKKQMALKRPEWINSCLLAYVGLLSASAIYVGFTRQNLELVIYLWLSLSASLIVLLMSIPEQKAGKPEAILATPVYPIYRLLNSKLS